MGNIRLYGSTSGYTELAPPAVAPDGVLSLPSGVGTLLTAEGGKVLQVVRATDTTNRSTTSTVFVDVTGMSVTITPQKSTSAVLILATGSWYVSSTQALDHLGEYRITDSSNNALAGTEALTVADQNVSFTSSINIYGPLFGLAYITPATTSPITYKLRFRVTNASSTMNIRNASNTGQMFAIEVSA